LASACLAFSAGARIIAEKGFDPEKIPARAHELADPAAQKAYLAMAGYAARVVGNDVYVGLPANGGEGAGLEKDVRLSEKIRRHYDQGPRSTNRAAGVHPASADVPGNGGEGRGRTGGGTRKLSWSIYTGPPLWTWLGILATVLLLIFGYFTFRR